MSKRWGYPTSRTSREIHEVLNLYNARPDWLAAAVFDAYDWPHNLSDEEILARLLALNLARAGA